MIHCVAYPWAGCAAKKHSMNIFVVNLKRSKDRKASMERQLECLGFPYSFIEAVDGKALTDEDLRRLDLGIYPPWPSFNARRLSRAEIGCILSHLSIYQRIIDECIDLACILEDDAVFKDNIRNTLIRVIEQLEHSDIELLMLGHFIRYPFDRLRRPAFFSKKNRDSIDYRIASPIEPPMGSHAYIIKRSAAIKLLEQAYPLRMPMDKLTGNSAAIGVQLRILIPPYIMQGRKLFTSTISDPHYVSLFLHRARRIKCFLGERFGILRTIWSIVVYPFAAVPRILRSIGLLTGDSYADKRYFQNDGIHSKQTVDWDAG